MGNEASLLLVRELNDRAYNVLWGLGAEKGDFACECGKVDCRERVELLVIEYAARDNEAVVAPGHKPAQATAAVLS